MLFDGTASIETETVFPSLPLHAANPMEGGPSRSQATPVGRRAGCAMTAVVLSSALAAQGFDRHANTRILAHGHVPARGEEC